MKTASLFPHVFSFHRPIQDTGRGDCLRASAQRIAVRSVGIFLTAWLGVMPTLSSAEQAEAFSRPDNKSTGRAELEALYARWKTMPRDELRKAADAGNAEAQYYWGDTEFDRAYQERNTNVKFERGTESFKYVLAAAKQGVLPAQHFAGIQLIGSIWWFGMPKDIPEGMKWLEQAARKGYEPSQHKLAEVYLAEGPNSSKFAEGINWLQKAADHGCRLAQYELARRYERGEGEPRHEGDSAVALLRKAKDQGLPEASLALAKRYRTGLGVAQDYIEAILTYRNAYTTARRFERFNPAEPPITIRMGRTENDEIMQSVADYLNCLAPDGNVDPNRPSPDPKFNEVFSVFVRGEDRGDPKALALLAEYHAKGINTLRDLKFGYIYYTLAAERGNESAAGERDKLRNQLSPDELTDAAMRIERYDKYHPVTSSQPRP